MIDKSEPLYVAGRAYAPAMSLADVHVHTRRSDGWFTTETLAQTALEAGLDAIVVTDHDDVRGGFELRDYVVRHSLPLTAYPGSEITARCDGRDVHILALGIEDDIPPWQNPEWTVEQILRQGGIPVLAHPYKSGSGYLRARSEIQLDLPVSMELHNASIADIDRFDPRARRADRNSLATSFYLRQSGQMLGPVGGTDAHFRTIGRGITAYDGDVLDSIRTGNTTVLCASGFERARPSDFVIYLTGLRAMKHQRARKWGIGNE